MGAIELALTGVLVTALGPIAPLPDLPAASPSARDAEMLTPVGPRPHPRLALLEVAVAVAGGAIWYYRDLNFNSVDFDYNWSRQTWDKKLITYQADRFDDNQFPTNVFWHPFDGTGIYLIARGNRLSPVTSLLITTAMATFWEFVVEYREVAAINDLIFTPVAGITIGEPMIRTAALLRTGTLGPVGRGLAAVLDPVGAFNGLFESGHQGGGEVVDDNGLPVRYPHRLQFVAGGGVTDFGSGQTRAETALGADFFVDASPELSTPGTRADLVGPGAITAMIGEGAVGDGHFVGFDFGTKVSLVGRQLRWADGIDDYFVTRTRRSFLGLGSGFEYATRSRPDAPEDEIGIAKLLGPLVNCELQQGDLRLHLLADATYDFTLVTAMALDGYAALNGTDALPNVLKQKRYYYAQGVSASLRLLAELGRGEAGLAVLEDDFWWIHGRNRIQPSLPEPAGNDRRAVYRLWFGVRPFPRLPLQITLAGAQMTRSGSLGEASRSVSELRVSTLLGLLF